MSRPDPAGVFASDEHRRVLANLSIPRSVATLGSFVRATDPHLAHVDDDSLREILADLEADGHARNLGEHATAEALIAHVEGLKTLDLGDPEVGDRLIARAENDHARYVEGEQWMATVEGQGRLKADPEGAPPPLTGSALKAAEDANARMAASDEQRAAEDRAALAEQYERAAADLRGEG